VHEHSGERATPETFPRRYYPDRVRRVFLSPTCVEHPWFNAAIKSRRDDRPQVAVVRQQWKSQTGLSAAPLFQQIFTGRRQLSLWPTSGRQRGSGRVARPAPASLTSIWKPNMKFPNLTVDLTHIRLEYYAAADKVRTGFLGPDRSVVAGKITLLRMVCDC